MTDTLVDFDTWWSHREADLVVRCARELREVLVELPKAELSPVNLSLLPGIDL
jgi:hypothetical protein